MNFRQCVIDCINEGEVVQSFNRLHERQITPQLLSLLSATGTTGTGQPGNQLSLAELGEGEQELLACFILFVHRHVWRKMKFAQSRVTRVREDRTFGMHVYVRCDGQLRPDFGTAAGQEAT
jgi:hypothetical protein